MQSIRTLQNLTGPTLTIEVPADFVGKQVEITIVPLENVGPPLPPEQDPRYAKYILSKPPLTEEDEELFRKSPYPLRGMSGEFRDPFEPAVPPEDWEVYRDDPAR